MEARTMSARYADTCRACGCRIMAGETMQYAGRGAIACATCPAPAPATSRPRGRTRARSFGRGGYTSSGAYVRPYSVNGHRCEDAPCCGCCS